MEETETLSKELENEQVSVQLTLEAACRVNMATVVKSTAVIGAYDQAIKAIRDKIDKFKRDRENSEFQKLDKNA